MEQPSMPSTQEFEKPAKKKSATGIITALVVMLAVIALWALGRYTSMKVPGVPKMKEGEKMAMELKEPSREELAREKGQWQAVFLTNGQVYFGHLDNPDAQYATLKEVYYLQVQQPLQQAASATSTGPVGGVRTPQQPQLVLIKFGTEIHRPDDWMKINRDHVLFWEDLTSDSTVVKSILQYKQQQQQGAAQQPQPTRPAPVRPQQP